MPHRNVWAMNLIMRYILYIYILIVYFLRVKLKYNIIKGEGFPGMKDAQHSFFLLLDKY